MKVPAPLREKLKLLFGPYEPPRLKQGNRAFCPDRDRDVLITGWSDAPISSPRCCRLNPPGTDPGLMLAGELARAVRHESGVADVSWWRISSAPSASGAGPLACGA